MGKNPGSQKFVMEGVQNRGLVGAGGRWGSVEGTCPSQKISDIWS